MLLLQTGVLGEGTFGVVVRACDPTTSGVEIAIKLLPRGETLSSPRPFRPPRRCIYHLKPLHHCVCRSCNHEFSKCFVWLSD